MENGSRGIYFPAGTADSPDDGDLRKIVVTLIARCVGIPSQSEDALPLDEKRSGT